MINVPDFPACLLFLFISSIYLHFVTSQMTLFPKHDCFKMLE
jgi:hypothetical protein